METTKRMHLFKAYGIELEYMIVDRATLDICPVADQLLKDAHGSITNEYNNGIVSWSNELVNHVIELKCTVPSENLAELAEAFHQNVLQINELLKKYNARLMPTAAHPWMNPLKETILWPHDQSDIYERYNEIFDCKGHGWSNLQSMHINLPFYDDEEFDVLHKATRLILPILPGLAASSPILDGKYTGYLDKRLFFYEKNQRKMPSITGKVIPENVHSKRQYIRTIYTKIEEEIAPYNQDGLLEANWLNSRGIIAKFDHGALEIRILDIQESPKADLSVAMLIILVIKMLVKGQLSDIHESRHATLELYEIYHLSITNAEKTIVANENYLQSLGISAKSMQICGIWQKLLDQVMIHYPEEMRPFKSFIDHILKNGTLATRILKSVDGQYDHTNLKLIYQDLTENLSDNKNF